MQPVVLNGTAIDSAQALHRALAAALDLPAWYGGNLDALYDCLTDLPALPEFQIIDPPALQTALGEKTYRGLLRVLGDAHAKVVFFWREESLRQGVVEPT